VIIETWNHNEIHNKPKDGRSPSTALEDGEARGPSISI